jgi:DNA-binding transcriptional ArsR family regulator
MQNQSIYEARAEILKAIAHPSRLAILDALTGGERCVCELQEVVGSDMSTVSRHLALMKGARLLSSRRDGINVYYRLRVPCVLRFFGCLEAVLAADAKERARLVRGMA